MKEGINMVWGVHRDKSLIILFRMVRKKELLKQKGQRKYLIEMS
jgi:hypothetical protein